MRILVSLYESYFSYTRYFKLLKQAHTRLFTIDYIFYTFKHGFCNCVILDLSYIILL